MKTAATIEVTVPENRKLELELPPEVPAGKAKLLVMVEEQVEGRELPAATVESVDGRLRLVLPEGADIDWERVSVKRSRDERTKKLLGMLECASPRRQLRRSWTSCSGYRGPPGARRTLRARMRCMHVLAHIRADLP